MASANDRPASNEVTVDRVERLFKFFYILATVSIIWWSFFNIGFPTAVLVVLTFMLIAFIERL